MPPDPNQGYPPPPPGGYPPPGGQPPPPPGQPGYQQQPGYGAPPPAAAAPLITPFGATVADPGKRIGAAVIDWVLISVVAFILRIVINSFFLNFFMWEIVLLVYMGVIVSQGKGQTVGQMALGLRTADKTTGANLDTAKGFTRSGVMALLAIPCGIPLLIDVLSPLWDKQREAWHDKVANSCVVEVPKTA